MKIGIIGSGSWGTALAKIICSNGQKIYWWNRSESTIEQFRQKAHHPHYLSSAKFDMNQISFTTQLKEVIDHSDVLIIAIPAAYVAEVFAALPKNAFEGKKILSAIKGILPQENLLLNEYLQKYFDVSLENYFAVLGPCHAEEVAAEKLSYLTFSGIDEINTEKISRHFKTAYIKTIVSNDIQGVQYAAILKNIYAVGAGIAHGLDYGDNFLSVFIANCADEMAGFITKANDIRMEQEGAAKITSSFRQNNYNASVYLGDLLVTCYSLFSRNRTFGTMVGKGYSVKASQLEMNMVAEGYNASKCMYNINQHIHTKMPIASLVYKILWEKMPAEAGFKMIEEILV